VVAPRRPAVSVWPQEHEKWADFEDLDVALLHGPKKDLLAQEKHDVYIVTFDGLRWLENSGHLKNMLKKKWLCTLIIDELSKVKHHKSGRHTTLTRWHDRFKRRWGLTGSIASNGLLYLYGQAYILDMGDALGQNFVFYRSQYFTPVDPDADFPKWAPIPEAKPLIYAAMKNLAIRIDAKDHLDMPKLIQNKITVELDPKARKVYDAMQKEMFALLDKMKIVTATTAAAASMKCQQIASGAIYDDLVDPVTGVPRVGKRVWNKVHEFKEEAFEDLIEELQGQQVWAAYWFGHSLERLQKLTKRVFGEVMPHIGAGVSDKKALAYEKAWNAGDIPLLLGQPNSVGHGLNFQGSSAFNVAWFDLTWDFELWDQFIRRILRQGNKSAHIVNHVLVVKDSVEEAQLAAIGSKRRGQDEIHDALNIYRRAHRA